LEGGEYLRDSGGVVKGEEGGIRGDLAGGGGGVFSISGVRGRSSCFERIGRGDRGGLAPGFVGAAVDIRGGSKGRDGVGGGFSTSCGFCGL
jgi:hypothetical protein